MLWKATAASLALPIFVLNENIPVPVKVERCRSWTKAQILVSLAAQNTVVREEQKVNTKTEQAKDSIRSGRE
jgi:hypothetical protein